MPNELWIVTDEEHKLKQAIGGPGYGIKRFGRTELLNSLKKRDRFQLPLIILIDCNCRDCLDIAEEAISLRKKLPWFGPICSPVIEFLKDDNLEPEEEEKILDYMNRVPDSLHIRAWKDLESISGFQETMKAALNRKLGFLVGKSPVFLKARKLVEKFAPTDFPVLITGSPGTGKELISFAIHLNSRRSDKRYVTLNCASLSEGLKESELFGHTKGAFTGADRPKEGILEGGNKGTVFLDQIESMSLGVQATLLRFLESGEITRVGEEAKTLQADVRIIAATNQDLRTLIKEGKFRQDFYDRLNVVCIGLPDLKDRGDDVLLLADHFLRELSLTEGRVRGFDQEVSRALQDYTWNGNVRQLRSVMQYAFVQCSGNLICLDDLPDWFPRVVHPGGTVQDKPIGSSKPMTSEALPLQTSAPTSPEDAYEQLNPAKRTVLTRDTGDIEIIKKALLGGNGSPHKAARLLKRAGFKKNMSGGAIRNMLGDSQSKKAMVRDLRSWYIENFNTPLASRIKQKWNV